MTREWGQEDAWASRCPLSWQTLPDLGTSTYLGLMPSALCGVLPTGHWNCEFLVPASSLQRPGPPLGDLRARRRSLYPTEGSVFCGPHTLRRNPCYGCFHHSRVVLDRGSPVAAGGKGSTASTLPGLALNLPELSVVSQWFEPLQPAGPRGRPTLGCGQGRPLSQHPASPLVTTSHLSLPPARPASCEIFPSAVPDGPDSALGPPHLGP